MINIIGNNIKLRQLTPKDAKSITENANNRDVSRFTFLPYPYSIDMAESFVRDANRNIKLGKSFELGIEKDGKVIGVVGLLNVSYSHKKAGIGFWLGKRYWRQGIMFEALNLIINFAFKELKLKRISATVLEGNKPSMVLLKKCGFHLEGKERSFAIIRGRSFDGSMFGLLAGDKR